MWKCKASKVGQDKWSRPRVKVREGDRRKGRKKVGLWKGGSGKEEVKVEEWKSWKLRNVVERKREKEEGRKEPRCPFMFGEGAHGPALVHLETLRKKPKEDSEANSAASIVEKESI